MKNSLYVAILMVFLLFLIATRPMYTPQDNVVFLDVGQGDSILFQRGTQQVLVDGGADTTVLMRLAEEMPWPDRRVEVVVATHPDKDHMGGVFEVVKRYEVGLVLLSPAPGSSHLQESWLNELQRDLAAKHVEVRFATRGQRLILDGLVFSILAPWPELVAQLHGETNDGSIVMRADYGDLSVLLTGDAEFIEERALLTDEAGGKLKVDVLKVGHHGSKGSTSAAFLAAVRPKLAAISAGPNNSYGHPASETLGRLAGVATLRTDQLGSIRLTRANSEWLLSCSQKKCIKSE
ncbi:MAG: MBL fold metallo-hydrolase [Candidatus Andersenbacteria bacterium]|nr:MBL fold metallo-hydrolase [Candidatus Andersenbacteria bacterium]